MRHKKRGSAEGTRSEWPSFLTRLMISSGSSGAKMPPTEESHAATRTAPPSAGMMAIGSRPPPGRARSHIDSIEDRARRVEGVQDGPVRRLTEADHDVTRHADGQRDDRRPRDAR